MTAETITLTAVGADELVGLRDRAGSPGAEPWAFVASRWSPSAPRAAGSAFHHTTDQAVESIMRSGLRPGSHAPPTRGLRLLQAHIELALNPAGGTRSAVLQIDVAGLRAAGYEIPAVTRVTGANGMAGGGREMRFPYEIPTEFLKVIR